MDPKASPSRVTPDQKPVPAISMTPRVNSDSEDVQVKRDPEEGTSSTTAQSGHVLLPGTTILPPPPPPLSPSPPPPQQQQQKPQLRQQQQHQEQLSPPRLTGSPDETLSIGVESPRVYSPTRTLSEVDGNDKECPGYSEQRQRPRNNHDRYNYGPPPPPPPYSVSPDSPFDEDEFCEYLRSNIGQPNIVRGGRITCWDTVHSNDEEFLLACIGACEGGINWKVAAFYFGHTKGATQKRFERFLQARKMWVADFWAMREKVTYVIDCFKRIGIAEPGPYACRELLDYFPNIPPVRTQARDVGGIVVGGPGGPMGAASGPGDMEDETGTSRREAKRGTRRSSGRGSTAERHNQMVQMRLMQQQRQNQQHMQQPPHHQMHLPGGNMGGNMGGNIGNIMDDEALQQYLERARRQQMHDAQINMSNMQQFQQPSQWSDSASFPQLRLTRSEELAMVLEDTAPTHTSAVVDAMPRSHSTIYPTPAPSQMPISFPMATSLNIPPVQQATTGLGTVQPCGHPHHHRTQISRKRPAPEQVSQEGPKRPRIQTVQSAGTAASMGEMSLPSVDIPMMTGQFLYGGFFDSGVVDPSLVIPPAEGLGVLEEFGFGMGSQQLMENLSVSGFGGVHGLEIQEGGGQQSDGQPEQQVQADASTRTEQTIDLSSFGDDASLQLLMADLEAAPVPEQTSEWLDVYEEDWLLQQQQQNSQNE